MSEQELNSYRFTSGQEPTDEMLAAIKHEAARDAAERSKKATTVYFEDMRLQAEIIKNRQSQANGQVQSET